MHFNDRNPWQCWIGESDFKPVSFLILWIQLRQIALAVALRESCFPSLTDVDSSLGATQAQGHGFNNPVTMARFLFQKKNPFHVSASVTERSSPGCFWHTVKYLHRFLWAQIGFLRCGELASSWDYTNYLLFLKRNLPCKPPLIMLHLHLLCFSRQKNTFEWGKLGVQTLQRWSCDSFQFRIPREGVWSYSVSPSTYSFSPRN